jgi:glycosyltransferase involved in cell wall biosynthesis
MFSLLTLGLYPSSGGPAKSIRAFQNALSAKVISWVDPQQFAAEPLVWDDSLIVTGSRWPILRQLLYASSTASEEAEQLIASSRLVSVHSFWRWHTTWVHSVCRKYGVPYWFVPHGGLDPYVLEHEFVQKRLFLRCGGNAFLRDAAAVICATDREREKLERLVPNDRIRVVPWPLDEADFRSRSAETRAAARQELGIPPSSLCFLYLGRLAPMKRPLETIRGFAAACLSDARLIIVGNEFGVTCEDCRRLARDLGVAERVHVIGPAYGQARYRYLDAADVYVSLSYRENFNFTAAESLASGLPVMLSPGNDLRSDLMGSHCCFHIADNKIETAAAMFREIASLDMRKIDEIGARGSKWARQTLGKRQFSMRIIDIAREIIKNEA